MKVINNFKFAIAMFSIFILVGAGCATNNQVNVATVSWEYDSFLDQVCLEVSDEAASLIGYPNEATDHICVSGDTQDMLVTAPVMGDTGTADVVLDNLELISDIQGRVYTVDVTSVE